ncbi:MAG: ribosome biogenesis GTPase Der [Leptonema sp. (in: bacteria)]
MNKKKLKKIAILGRKNVGKSSLLNLLAHKNRSIVEDYPGLTRDILEVEIKNYGVHALFCDFPGLDIDETSTLERQAKEKAIEYLKKEIDLILFLMEPPAPSKFDWELKEFLHKNISKPILFILNKVDSQEKELEFLSYFYEEGFQVIPISTKSKYNFKKFINILKEILPEIKIKEEANKKAIEGKSEKKQYKDSTVVSDFTNDDIRISIVGKPNVGKSTLFNFWIGKEMSLVTDVPGTTRDTLDTVFQYFGHTIRILDTAGLRKKTAIKDPIEFYASRRTQRAIQDSDIVIQVLSATEGITEQDKKITALIQKLNKPMILFVNKWDAISEKHSQLQKEYLENLYKEFPLLRNIPIYFGSALTKKRAMEPLKSVLDLYKKLNFRIQTSSLNQYIKNWFHGFPHNQKFKIYYTTQVDTKPPFFIIFCNNKKLVSKNLNQFLENKIREEFNLRGIPIRIKLKEKDVSD